ncbi:MXAN_5187 C-terminal domain-containing protein [Archangium sp.]|uniref:MXAN_5187 C-terminal domain-containing protein n=1 Tax=Archangium sp. TaxID=1872627 RepID=UPI00286CAE65|nr:MXAN_5187 C-terminal domain-containing protein [Archangium sp.]
MAYESSKSSTKNQIAKPGASTKSTAKLAASSGDTKSGMPTRSGSEVAAQECDAIEADLAALKVTYEQYFLGMERTPPTRTYEELKKRVERLKNSFVRNTGAKFRVQAVAAKFVSYERLWQRTLLEIENGTYKRDMFKAKRKSQPVPDKARSSQNKVVDLTEDADFEVVEESSSKAKGSVPSVAPMVPPVPSMEPVPFRGVVPSVAPLVPSVAPLVPPVARLPSIAPLVPPVAPAIAPVAARPAGTGPRPAAPVRPPSAGSASELSDDKLKTVYDAYVAAKRRNKEDTSKMSYDNIAASLRKQVPELMKQHGAKAVEFKVVIKDGKAVLKAVPK